MRCRGGAPQRPLGGLVDPPRCKGRASAVCAEDISLFFVELSACSSAHEQRRRTAKWISEMFLTRLCVAAKLDCTSSSMSLLANGGKEVTLRYRFTFDSNWPLGTRVVICA
jgi:hypothetical protein